MAEAPTDPHAHDARPYSGGDPWADYRSTEHAFTGLVDLADRRLGGSVVAANDEFFAHRENLLKPGPAEFDPEAFGHKGKVMDGWETRRRRNTAEEPFPGDGAHDWALIRLGLPGVVRGVMVDTAHFRGNYPQQASVEAVCLPGTPSPEELLEAEWTEIVPRSQLRGHAANGFAVDSERRWTHLRLKQYPDGGIARLRVHGEVVPDPEWLSALGTFDLAALENGGVVEDASDRFYSPPENTILPGRSRKMDDGWENRRRRVRESNDWVLYRLAAHGEVRAIEIDTAYLKGNAAGWIEVSFADAAKGDLSDPSVWTTVLPRTRLQPDSPHRFLLDGAPQATHARIDVFPDGGYSRVRFHGSLTPAGLEALRARRARH
ncbi:allantoicase [Nocardiopsis sp. RSe5-2]|uniref:Probable allantoicase n=1 Tax=Nocardiopsis endophytica TaxID=3018445 RepID=A0ABT4U5R1_9ACTN|nr:allantoicase [Nocardiopsis endophytica]MDA2812293.1 allantoicase [Nocardiopsis endophytica]